MRDITQYSDEELSLLFLNEQDLYNDFQRAVRRNNFEPINHLCDELFIYTPDQLEDLRTTFEQEVEEYERE